jgi:hypothetical protein
LGGNCNPYVQNSKCALIQCAYNGKNNIKKKGENLLKFYFCKFLILTIRRRKRKRKGKRKRPSGKTCTLMVCSTLSFCNEEKIE